MGFADRCHLKIPFPAWARDNNNQPERDFENWKELQRWADDFYRICLPASGGKLPFYVAASDASDESKALSNYVCTGTDDQDVIQQAVDDLVAFITSTGTPYFIESNAPLWFSEGIFYLSGPVDCSGLTIALKGAGKQRTIFQRVGSAGTDAAFSSGEPISAFGLTFHDFYRCLYQTTGSFNDQGAAVNECWFEDCNYPITFYDADWASVTDCRFYDAQLAIQVDHCDYTTIADNGFFSSSYADIYCASTGFGSATITGNVSNTSGRFIEWSGFLYAFNISGNTVEGVVSRGISIVSTSVNTEGGIISGNWINAGTNPALFIDGPTINTADAPSAITGNHFIGTARVDVRAHVTGNYISGGIQFNDPCDKALCSNNWLGDTDVHGSAAPTIADNTTGTVVSVGAGNYLDGTWT